MTNLEVLSLSLNKISSLKPFKNLFKLRELYLRENQINSIADLHNLKNLKNLQIVWLSSNPVSLNPSYKNTLIQLLPNLQKLDDVPITSTDR